MIHKQASPFPNHARVLFEVPATLWAARILVVGDFGQGAPSQTPLIQERDGVWRATLDLPVGQHYPFRYWVDGAWYTDSHADGFATTSDGRYSSLIKLS